MMNVLDFKYCRYNVIGQSSIIRGEVLLQGPTRICGQVEGKLVSTEKSHLVIDQQARVKGQLEGHDIEIYGTFEGEIIAQGKLSLKPGSQVDADVKAAQLVIYPGALFNSKTSVG